MPADEVAARLDRATLCPTCGTLPGLHRADDTGRFTRCPLTRATLHGRPAYASLVRADEPTVYSPLTWLERMNRR